MVVVSVLTSIMKVDNPMEIVTKNLVEWLFMVWDKLYISRGNACV